MSLVRRYLILLVALSLIGAGAAAAYSLNTSSVYRASTALYFVASSESVTDVYQATLAGQQRIFSYRELIRDPKVIEDAIAEAGLTGEVSVDYVTDNLLVEVPPNTVVLNVSVDHPNAQTAADLANALAKTVISLISRVESPAGEGDALIGLTVIERATPPDEFQPTLSPVLVAAGTLVGGLLVVLVGAVHWFARRMSARSGTRTPRSRSASEEATSTESLILAGPVVASQRRREARHVQRDQSPGEDQPTQASTAPTRRVLSDDTSTPSIVTEHRATVAPPGTPPGS